jgi:hypothetical protein
LHWYHLSESTVSRDRSTPSACGNLNAAIGLLHPFLGHQGVSAISRTLSARQSRPMSPACVYWV